MERLFSQLNFNASRQLKMTSKTRTVLAPANRHRESGLFPTYSKHMDIHSHGKTLLPTSLQATGPLWEQELSVTGQEGLARQTFTGV